MRRYGSPISYYIYWGKGGKARRGQYDKAMSWPTSNAHVVCFQGDSIQDILTADCSLLL